MKNVVAIVLVILFLVGNAHADLLCARKKAKAKKGKVSLAASLQATTDSTCPKGFEAVFDSSASQGPQGPQGAQGPSGVVDIASCRHVSDSSDEIGGATDVTFITLNCASDEYLLTHFGDTSSINLAVLGYTPLGFSGEEITRGVTYSFGRVEPALTFSGTAFALAVCCPGMNEEAEVSF